MEEAKKRALGLGFLVAAIMQIILALVAACNRHPDARVTWKEMVIILLIQAAILAVLAIRLLWFNYSYFG